MVISYVNSKRTIKYLCDFEIGKTYDFSIKIDYRLYEVSFGDNVSKIHRYSTWKLPRILLKPYFGGKQKAPKEFKIKIT